MNSVIGLPKEGKYLLGVSGGCDSMTLLSLCLKEGLDVIVCFVNYGVREITITFSSGPGKRAISSIRVFMTKENVRRCCLGTRRMTMWKTI